ncbi:hypothetical protein T265_03722 [Opisthorchis viverrini]|uniref:Uncharacterized protein n=1 Tax=Opisthorchis viverrini TaxID=6198 RepID=A0A075A2G1_OPIVI|nr:hypothetical protein T265_03722 [Opisthorchis viverrini]KER29705.1 hypothetical protein T265_03722 [Opisthorchis viverrini]
MLGERINSHLINNKQLTNALVADSGVGVFQLDQVAIYSSKELLHFKAKLDDLTFISAKRAMTLRVFFFYSWSRKYLFIGVSGSNYQFNNMPGDISNP